MPIISLGPFSPGLRGDYGFSGTRGFQPQELRNYFPNRSGFLERRGGSSHLNSTAHGAILKEVFVAPFTYEAATGVPITVPRILGVAYSATALQLVSGSSYTEIKQGLSSGDASLRLLNFDQATPPFKMFDGRLFVGLYSGSSRGFMWMDSTSLGSSECYPVGHSAPAAAPTVAAANGGSLTNAVYYSYRYTYYNSTYGIETIASDAASDVTASPNLTMNVTCTQIIDKGFDQFRVYRNQTGQTSAALAEAADHYLVAAVNMTNGASTQVFADTGTQFNSVAYTLNTAQSYLDVNDHDVLSEIPVSMEVWNDRLWVATEPRTLAWSKKTTESLSPDWFPLEQQVSIGSSYDRISAVVASPTTEILMVFSRDAVFTITLEGPTGLEVNQFASVGCPFPRTVQVVGDWVYFLGSDLQVWRTNGATLTRVSKQVNHLLSHIKPSWHMFPCAARYKDTYQLFFSSGSSVFDTENTTVTTHSNQVVSSTVSTTARLTPSSGTWTLTPVVVGMFVEGQTNPSQYFGYVCAIDDTNDYLDVDGNAQALGTEDYSVLKNDRAVVYNQTHDYWYEVRGWDYGAVNWDSVATGNFYAATSDGGYVDTIHTTATTDAAGASTAAITSLAKFEPIRADDFKSPTGRFRINQIYVFPSGTATAVTVNLYKDYGTSVNATSTGTPAEGTNFAIGISPTGHARAWEVEVTGDASATQAAIDIEYEELK